MHFKLQYRNRCRFTSHTHALTSSQRAIIMQAMPEWLKRDHIYAARAALPNKHFICKFCLVYLAYLTCAQTAYTKQQFRFVHFYQETRQRQSAASNTVTATTYIYYIELNILYLFIYFHSKKRVYSVPFLFICSSRLRSQCNRRYILQCCCCCCCTIVHVHRVLQMPNSVYEMDMSGFSYFPQKKN